MCPDKDHPSPVSPLLKRLLVDLAAVTEAVGRLDRDLVALAREEGISWNVIADAFGMSRQAATKYYKAEPQPDPAARERRPRRQKPPNEPPG